VLNPDAQQLEQGRQRLTQVFEYLAALNQHRNPAKRNISEQPWSRWLRDLPNHPTIQRGDWKSASQQVNSAEQTSEDAVDDFVIQVDRPTLTKAPLPSAEVAPWLLAGWEAPEGQVEIQRVRNVLSPAGEATQERFEDDAVRMRAFTAWKTRRDAWAEAERPARRANDVFEDLYELRGQIEREGERIELVLGDGILDWRHPTGRVHHPILVQRLVLEFDASIPRFTVREADQPTELYTQLLHSLQVDGAALQRLLQAMTVDPLITPLNDALTTNFLRRLIVEISDRARGQYLDLPDPANPSDAPRLWRDLVLFVRARNQGFSLAIEAIREDLRATPELPQSLLRIVGIDPLRDTTPGEAATTPSAGSRGNEDINVLLTKPANGEQLQIAKRLDRYGCVLVQGPPGTGKTHTIGNLIGHLLAQGKSVLVTSHSVKALRVLREQVVKELQPLCVSVLDAGGESQAQLQGAIGEIVNRLQEADADTLDEQAAALQSQRARILDSLERARVRLRDARNEEYRDVIIAGQAWAPSDAARIVANGEAADSWIPSPVVAGVPLPLSVVEIAELYQTNVTTYPQDEVKIDQLLTESAQLPKPDEFQVITERIRGIQERGLIGRADLWEANGSEPEPATLIDAADTLVRSVQSLGTSPGWELAAIDAGRAGDVHRAQWDDFVQVIRDTYTVCMDAQIILLRHGPSLPAEGSPPEHLRVAGEILRHLQQGGKLRFVDFIAHRSWRKFVNAARVGGQAPREAVHFEALEALARVRVARDALVGRWERQMVPLGGPTAAELGDEPERVCVQYVAPMGSALGWWREVLTPLANELQQAGFRWDRFLSGAPPNHSQHGELAGAFSTILSNLLPIIAAKADQLQIAADFAQLAEVDNYLVRTGGAQAGNVVKLLRDSIANHDSNAYREAFERLVALERQRLSLVRRRVLLSRLAALAPAWAEQIQSRRRPHNDGTPPGDTHAAWRWRQLNDELGQRAATSLDAILREIDSLSAALQQTTIALVDRRAWAAQRRRTSLEQQQSLVGWRQMISRIGQGTGRRAPLLRSRARELMKTAQGAVPVWIMPLARVVETYDPRATHFDVVVIDEASQSDVMALCALYLGKSVVVVGDHEQVSPLAIGQQMDQVQRLIDAHLANIPNRDLYDGKLSVYDLAQTSFGGLVCLREHFRCVPEIIEFSNRLAYEDKIVPLRDSSSVQLKPHTIAHRVNGTVDANNVNREEAVEIASLVAAAAEQPEYAESTFGVISLLGEEQARAIDVLLRQHLPPMEYERRRIICGNAAQFQGDERDVMFLSVVDAPQDGTLPMRANGPDGLFKKRYNVAASRARDQMWVVHSLNPTGDLQAGDLRRRLIEHAMDPGARLREIERLEAQTESPFERQVLGRLITAGYRVVPQYAVGAYRIDLVVVGGSGRLAVECDGDRFHTLDNLGEDIERQALLERLGWTFVRIRGTEFFRDPERAMQPVFARLQELEITPEERATEAIAADSADSDLRERVVRRAAHLRQEWQGQEVGTAGGEPDSDRTIEQDEDQPPATTPPTEQVLPTEEIRRPIQPRLPFVNNDNGLPQGAPLPRDPILRAIARNLGRDWQICPGCGGHANLQHGPLGPYSDCFQPWNCSLENGRQPISTPVISTALRELRASCPRCMGQLVVPEGALHPTVQCSGHACHFTIPWHWFCHQPALIQV